MEPAKKKKEIERLRKAGAKGQATLRRNLKAKYGKDWKQHFKKIGSKGGKKKWE